MNQAVIEGIAFEYEEAGEGEPVVCIHGAVIADAFRPLLSESGRVGRYRIISYRRRGYAGSGGTPMPATLAEHAADCRRLLSHLDVRRVHVVGHSLGGAIGIQLALDAPQLVRTLTLLEAAIVAGESAQLYRQGLERSIRRYREAGAGVAVDEFLELRWPAYRDRLERSLPGAFAQALADAASCFESDIPALLEWRFGEAEARRITQPCLVVLGEASVALNPRFHETYRLLLDWLPNAEGAMVPDATHFVQVEQPRTTAAALTQFLARHPLASE